VSSKEHIRYGGCHQPVAHMFSHAIPPRYLPLLPPSHNPNGPGGRGGAGRWWEKAGEGQVKVEERGEGQCEAEAISTGGEGHLS